MIKKILFKSKVSKKKAIINIRVIITVTLRAQMIFSTVSHQWHAVCVCVYFVVCVNRRGINPKQGIC